jgi:hypothetical protein
MKKIVPLALIAVFLCAASARAAPVTLKDDSTGKTVDLYPLGGNFLVYSNTRFGYSVRFPHNYFTKVVLLPENEDGIILESEDGEARLRVSGGFVIGKGELRSSYDRACEAIGGEEEATYFEIGDDYWELGWMKGDTSHSRKFLINTEGGVWSEIEIDRIFIEGVVNPFHRLIDDAFESLGFFASDANAEQVNELPREKEVKMVLEGDEYTFIWTLATSGRYGYAIYLDPDYELREGDGYDLIAPRHEPEIMQGFNIRIYEVAPGTPVPGSKGLHGVTSMADYRRFAVGDKTFEAELNYPSEASGSGIRTLAAMAETITEYRSFAAGDRTFEAEPDNAGDELQAQQAEAAILRVSTAREFLEALGSDRTILMEPGEYLLSTWDPYYDMHRRDARGFNKEVELPMNSGVQWDMANDGGELLLKGIKNLTIRGIREGGRVNIVVHPRYAWVMKFQDCMNIVMENIRAGHSEGGYCGGGVFIFVDSSLITLTNVSMYGCGTEGMQLHNVSDLTATNSSIFECTFYIMTVSDSKNIAFRSSLFNNNGDSSLINVYDTENMSFDDCRFSNNLGTLFNVHSPVSVSNSVLINNSRQEHQIQNSPNVSFTDCTFTENRLSAEAEKSKRGVVLGDRVRMRADPNTSATIVRQLNKGETLDVLDSYKAAHERYPWYQVRHEGDTGWVYGEFLKED